MRGCVMECGAACTPFPTFLYTTLWPLLCPESLSLSLNLARLSHASALLIEIRQQVTSEWSSMTELTTLQL